MSLTTLESPSSSDSSIAEKMRSSERYPYTYACDYIREKIGNDYGKGLISRAAASQARSAISEATGMDDKVVAKALAEKFIEKYIKIADQDDLTNPFIPGVPAPDSTGPK